MNNNNNNNRRNRTFNSFNINSENEQESKHISLKTSITRRKSDLKSKQTNSSQIKNNSLIKKFISKNVYDKNSKKENLEIKKTLTQKLFMPNTEERFVNNNKNMVNSKSKTKNEFKIKVQKIYDLYNLTLANIANQNTSESNKNHEIHQTIFKNHNFFDKVDSEKVDFFKKITFNKFKDLSVNRSVILTILNDIKKHPETITNNNTVKQCSLTNRNFPMFKNSFIINENVDYNCKAKKSGNNGNETSQYLKYSEINSLSDSNNDFFSNSSLVKKNSSKILHPIEENNNNYHCSDKNNNLNNIEDKSNQNTDLDPGINKKSCPVIKETFTLFLQNNSKKEYLSINQDKINKASKEFDVNNCNKTSNTCKEAEIEKKKIPNNKIGQINEINSAIGNSKKKFYSPQKSRLKFSKTNNYFLSSDINLEELMLNQKLSSCDNLFSCIEYNKKLKSDMEILNEKVKTLKKIQQTKNHEIEILKNKYTDAINNYKKEIEKNKDLKNEINKQALYIKNLKRNFKIITNNFIEITEMLLLSKTNNFEKRASAVENASFSIDIYDSYNNEDEKRCLLQEQIQNLLIAKLNFFKKQLDINFELEIEKIKNWNANINLINGKHGNYLDIINISNLRLSVKNNENDSFESSKKNISQDYFDLSISNQFLNLNNIPSGNFGNIGNNINININQSPQFIFTNNNYSSKQNALNNSFGVIDGETENIFGSNSHKNYSSNTNNNITNINNNLLNKNIYLEKGGNDKNIKSNKNINHANSNNFDICSNNNSNYNLNNAQNNNFNIIFNKEEQQEINDCSLNNLNYNSNAGCYNSNYREERLKNESINNLIGAVSNNKTVGLNSNYNSNSNNIYDSFLQSAKGHNDSFSNSANDSILQMVNLNNPISEKDNKIVNKSKTNLNEIEFINDLPNDSLTDVENPLNLKEKINKIQNDSHNFIFEDSKAKSDNYHSDIEIKQKFICDDLGNNINSEINNHKDNNSEKNDGKKLKKMFSFEL